VKRQQYHSVSRPVSDLAIPVPCFTFPKSVMLGFVR
jgi:hypothetical protein